MAKINKVGHVVLGCRDPQASIKFYTETLGMELVQFNQELQMGFFSFGEQHHDIAVIFFDPDGNRLEIFCESMEMAAAKNYLQTTYDLSKLMAPLNLEPTTA